MWTCKSELECPEMDKRLSNCNVSVSEHLRLKKLRSDVNSRISWNMKSHVLLVSLICAIVLVTPIERCDAFSIEGVDLQRDASLTVDYFEPVFYNPSELLSQHTRKKREIGNKESLKVNLFSKSRNFNLHLSEDRSIFHPEVVIENSVGPVSYDTSRVLSGHLEDDPDSFVEGLISSDGQFDGLISTGEGQNFFIEPTVRYSDVHPNSSQGIVYESSAIQWPLEHPICPSHELHLNRKFHENSPPEDSHHPSTSERTQFLHTTKNPVRHSSSSLNSTKVPRRRNKRYVIDAKRKTCMLYLQADHLFFTHFGSEEAAINMMARHIQRVNEIYRTTDFDGDGTPDGITFMIKRIKVHNMNHTTDPNYKYNGNFPVIKFLERFSEGDYESFCLAYMFTFRDFEGGTLGLAWTGDLKNAGGVCERKGHFRGGLKSLNTGIVTLLNYGKVVLPAVSYVTLAHEIGHSFGSPHDPESDKECTPGGKDGNYIMYARATAGDQKNNQRFSSCSLRHIIPVLNTKARNIHGCFTEPQRGICGNREVEEGEECDCGWEEDCKEPCCWPMRTRYDPKEIPCTLKPRKECSPSQGPCCTANCTLRIGDKCRDDNGCRHSAKCDGYMPSCPPSVHKPNKTVCHEEQNVCFMGECTGSICLAYGLESCQCSPQPWDSASKLCELCCKKPGEGQPCVSSFEWNEAPYDVPNLFGKPGSPCKNYTGYCDSYHTCREVDPSGPLATLRNLLLADEGLTAIAEWIDAHWYAVISFIALLIVMMILTAKLCGKQAQKKLRKITVVHSNVEAIQVERSYWDESGEHVVHPAAVRKKIPLRKKIREKSKSKSKSRSSRNKPSRPGNGGDSGGGGGGGEGGGGGGGGGGASGATRKFGTLWKKKRGERAKLPSPHENKTETSATLNGDVQSPTSSGTQQTFDLVQIQTPPVPSSSSSGGRPPPPPPLLENSSPQQPSSSSSPRSPPVLNTAGSSVVGDPLTAALVNHHEAKTAILPSSSAGRRNKRRSSKRPSSTREQTGHIGKSRSSHAQRHQSSASRLEQTAGASSRKKQSSRHHQSSVSKEKEQKPKKSIQIVYTPPFSLKVMQVESKGDCGNKSPNGSPNVHSSAVPNSESNLPSSSAPVGVAKNGPKSSGSSGSKGVHSKSSGNEKSPPPVSSGPPPYSKMIDRPLPPIVESQRDPVNSSGSQLKPGNNSGDAAAPSKSSSNSQNMRVKSKVKSSGSFLQRRKAKGNEKGELRVLIPPPNQEEDEATTPVTPMH